MGKDNASSDPLAAAATTSIQMSGGETGDQEDLYVPSHPYTAEDYLKVYGVTKIQRLLILWGAAIFGIAVMSGILYLMISSIKQFN